MADIIQLREKGIDKYLKTHVDAIDGINGKLMKASGNEEVRGEKNFLDGLKINGKKIDATLAQALLNTGKQAWSGAAFLHADQTITPSIPLNDCLTGWLVCYQPYTSKTGKAEPWDMNYVLIPKTHGRDFPGVAVVHHLETLNGSRYNKYIYVTNTTIKGHKNNDTASKDYVATKVYSI